LKKAINKILLINTNSLILRARWKTGGKYYDCKSWEPSMNESNTYNVQFMDGDKRTNVPLNEIKLPSLKLPVSFWILCNHMNHLLSSEVNNRKISKEVMGPASSITSKEYKTQNYRPSDKLRLEVDTNRNVGGDSKYDFDVILEAGPITSLDIFLLLTSLLSK
jgi:hypothetical protein